jgi:hypothetical protein
MRFIFNRLLLALISDSMIGETYRGSSPWVLLWDREFADWPLEATGFEPSVPRRERNESCSGPEPSPRRQKFRLDGSDADNMEAKQDFC